MGFEVHNKLKNNSISSSVYSCHTIKPLDEKGIINILKKYKKVILMEEHVPNGGLKDKLLALAYKNKINSKIFTFTLKDKFIHFYGNHKEILNIHGLSSDKIFKKVIEK